MKKIKKTIAVILTVVLSSLMCICALADDPVYVTVDGKAIQYAQADAQPMIYNSRAMVPIRTTAEALGLTVGWDKETETASFTSADGSRVIKHTMRSNIIYVNGTPSSFDTSSIVVNDRILMPIRMLAEAMGSDVSWDNPSRTVIIETKSLSPEIESATLIADEITQGDEAEIVCVANGDTASVRLYYQTGAQDVKEVTEYTDNGDGSRTFKINFVPTNDGNEKKTYLIYAGDGSSYYGSKEVTINVNEDFSDGDNSADDGLDEYIYKVTLDSTKVEKGDYVNFTVLTTDDVVRLRVESSFSSSYTTVSDYTEKSGKRTFNGKLKMTTTGSCHLYIFVYTAELGTYSEDYRIVDFRGISPDDDDEEEAELKIKDIIPSMSVTARTEETKLYIYTTSDIDYVEVFDDDDTRVAYSNYTYDEFSATNVFVVSWTEKTSGTNRYNVVAYNEDDDDVSDSIRITCESSPGSSGPFVINVEPKKDSVETGESSTFVVKCSTGTDYIVIKDDDGKTLYSTEGSSTASGASYKKFSAKFEVPSVNEYYTIYAYSDDGEVDVKNFYVYGTDNAEPEITNVDYDVSVEEGDDVSVRVYTTTSVAKVWIEDEDDDSVTNKLKKPTKENSDELIWEFTFSPDDSGRRTYTIYAENEDGDDYDSETIKIKVS